jgi:uncharacterized membrane protein
MSQYNPYAAPQAGPQMPMAPQYGGGGGPQPWEIGDVLGHAWNVFKPNWATLLFSYLLALFIGALPGQVPGILVQAGALDQQDAVYAILLLVFSLVGYVIGAFFQAGYIKIWLAAARGQTPQFGDLFSGGGRFFWVFLANLLLGLAIGFGLILLIVPGIILACGLWFTPYFVVDQNMGPIDALSASWKATDGNKGKIFLFALVAFLIILASELACCLPVLVALPVVGVAGATIYLRLTGTGGGGGGMGYGAPPGGGFAPPPQGYGAPPAGGFGGPPGGPGGYGPPGGYGGPGAPPGGGYGPPPQGY